MTRLTWNPPVNPRYEMGCDRGVLKTEPAGYTYPWNGLISVEEAFIGGEREANYFDGIKISDSISSRNWQANIRAFSYPGEMASIFGYTSIRPGVYLTRQPRTEFWLSYRTRFGDGSYKLHFVYNATIVPSQPARKTLTETPDPDIYEWTINAVPWKGIPTTMPLAKPTAHYTVDSSEVSAANMEELETYVYGDPNTTLRPAFPSPQKIFDIISV